MHTDFINQHTEALKAVTPSQANDACRSLVDPDDMTVVIAGDARALVQHLDEYSPEVVELGT